MQLIINGNERELGDSLTVTLLLEQLGLKAGRIALELNRNILPRTKWSETVLNDGDSIEIVHFVGGGESRPMRRGVATRLHRD